jgi:glycosyl transferase, family 25
MVQAFVINLDRSPDRLIRMQTEFARVGMTFTRFPAIDGTALPHDLQRSPRNFTELVG